MFHRRNRRGVNAPSVGLCHFTVYRVANANGLDSLRLPIKRAPWPPGVLKVTIMNARSKQVDSMQLDLLKAAS